MIDTRQLQRRLRRALWAVALGALAYLVWRYDTERLPEGSCSPLSRFAAGDLLLCDRRPPGLAAGDAVLFRGPTHSLYLGLIERVQPEGAPRDRVDAVWITTDRPDCPGVGSDQLGWIERDAVRARVMFAWPW